MEFKDRLKMLRKERKLTQDKLGEMLNYGCTTIANYEAGRNQPSIPDLKKIASIFNVSMDYLLGVNDIRHPYVMDDQSAEFNEFRRRYTLLGREEREMLLDYMDYLALRSHGTGSNSLYGEAKAKATPLRAAQKAKDYE